MSPLLSPAGSVSSSSCHATAAGPWSRTQPWSEPFQLVLLWRRLVSQRRPEAPEQLRSGPGRPGAAVGAAGGRPDGGVPPTCPQTAERTDRDRPRLPSRCVCVLVLPSRLHAASSFSDLRCSSDDVTVSEEQQERPGAVGDRVRSRFGPDQREGGSL